MLKFYLHSTFHLILFDPRKQAVMKKQAPTGKPRWASFSALHHKKEPSHRVMLPSLSSNSPHLSILHLVVPSGCITAALTSLCLRRVKIPLYFDNWLICVSSFWEVDQRTSRVLISRHLACLSGEELVSSNIADYLNQLVSGFILNAGMPNSRKVLVPTTVFPSWGKFDCPGMAQAAQQSHP